MEHTERVEIAKKILGRIKKKYGSKIVAGGIYGSVARNEDTEMSDIDLILITENDAGNIENGFLYKDIPVSYWSMEVEEAKQTVRNPDFGWPWKVNSLVNFDVVIGDSSFPEGLSEEIEEIPMEKFRKAVRDHLTNIYEYYYKIQKYHRKGEFNNLLFAVWDCLNGLLGSVALLNRKYFIRNDFYRFKESFGFEETPEDYEKLVGRCYSSKDPEEITKAFNELFQNFEKFLKDHGVSIQNYSDLDDVEL